MAHWVMPPLPISGIGTWIVTVSSAAIDSEVENSCAPALPAAKAAFRPRLRPPPTAAALITKPRRLRFVIAFMASGLLRHGRGGLVDRRADAWIGAAAADVAHRGVDLGVGGLRRGPQQRVGRHQHAGLAIAALRHVDLDPGLLQRMGSVLRKAFDGLDLAGAYGAERRLAGPHRRAVDVHGAGPALGDA